MQKQYNFFLILLLSLISFAMNAQEEKKILRKGNDAYNTSNMLNATSYYKNAIKEKPTYYKANFNLGDALYKIGTNVKTGKMLPPDPKMKPDSAANVIFEQAAEQFEVVAKSVSHPDTIQNAWHNYGNAKLQQKSYEDAIMGYKKALKMNPKDEDTRYNLAYAQRKLKEQQKNQNKNQNKNDKQQEKNQKEKDKEKVNNPNDKDKNEAQQPQMSKEQAEKMLNALKNSEKNNQKLREKKGEPGQKKNVEKDW